MSLASYTNLPTKSPRSRKSANSRRNPSRRLTTATATTSRRGRAKVEKLPTPSASPANFSQTQELTPELKLLWLLQQGSAGIALVLTLATLAVYAWSIYVPKLWGKEYRHLETLQRHERHLTATNESLKNQLAQQAEKPEMGLADPHPAQSIFLPATSAATLKPPQSLTPPESQLTVPSAPVAY
jgi:hypothetical protein